MPDKMVKKRSLSFAIFILFFFLVGFVALYCENNDRQLKKEGKIPANNKKGDKKMGTAKWLSEDEGKYLLGVDHRNFKKNLVLLLLLP